MMSLAVRATCMSSMSTLQMFRPRLCGDA
jgi:hypothetical protein